MVTCPKCRATHVWKVGSRPTSRGMVQMYMCVPHGHRFSKGEGKLPKKRTVTRRRR